MDNSSEIDKILAKMNKCIEDGEGVDYDYYGDNNMADEKFTLADMKAAINAYTTNKIIEAILETWYYTGEGYNGEYDGLTHNGGKRYTGEEVEKKVVADVLEALNHRKEK